MDVTDTIGSDMTISAGEGTDTIVMDITDMDTIEMTMGDTCGTLDPMVVTMVDASYGRRW